jgi:hypothetical protein
MQTTQGVIAQLAIQATQGDGIGSRVSEQGPNRRQLTIVLAQSTQCLDTGDTAGGGIDERLKAGERLPVDHKASLVDLVFGWSLLSG